MSKHEGMIKPKKTRADSFVIRALAFFRHSPAAPKLREGGSFEFRHS